MTPSEKVSILEMYALESDYNSDIKASQYSWRNEKTQRLPNQDFWVPSRSKIEEKSA